MTLRSEVCGRFTIVGAADILDRDESGAVLLLADRSYVVQIPAEAGELPLVGALRQLPGASDAVLRFSGFIGDTRLDDRVLRVRSPKLTAVQVDEMLGAIRKRLAALPFAFATPVGATFARDLVRGPDISYQAAVLILDALSGRSRHDLRAAVARILGNPHTVLRTERAIVPLPLADRLGPTSLIDALTGASLSPPLPPGHPMSGSPAAVAFGARIPERLTVDWVTPDQDTAENRFVAGVLDACIDAVDRVLEYARDSNAAGAEALMRECTVAHETIRVWRSHKVLMSLRPIGPAPLNSTVLQRQPGYRHVLSFWMDLLGRTRWLPDKHSLSLLALRDAPTLYEYWCYFEVVAAVEVVEGPPVAFDRPLHDEGSARLTWSSRARFESGVVVVFNERFRGRDSTGSGPASASVPLRPDVVLHRCDGCFHVLDAKFRRAGITSDRDDEAAEGEDAAKQADVHKMHAYRDALGARSAWVLYPGRGSAAEFAPHGLDLDTEAPPLGVGTIPLAPGPGGDQLLRQIVKRMLVPG